MNSEINKSILWLAVMTIIILGGIAYFAYSPKLKKRDYTYSINGGNVDTFLLDKNECATLIINKDTIRICNGKH
jgi:hypothetical protein